MVTNEEKMTVSQSPPLRNTNKIEPISPKPYGGKRVDRSGIMKPIASKAATKADEHFNTMVKDCVKSLRVHKDQK